jgi:hypothetical protein
MVIKLSTAENADTRDRREVSSNTCPEDRKGQELEVQYL